jgi:hypothetical protein
MDTRLATLQRALSPDAPLSLGGGCIVSEVSLHAGWFAKLQSEVRRRSADAREQEVVTGDADDIRGGTPPRRLMALSAGPALNGLYSDSALRETLSRLCGARVAPRGPEGSYSIYARPGDYLGLHRDMDQCDVALITVLEDTAAPGEGGALVIYRQRRKEKLATIRARPHAGAEAVYARPGQSILLAGGLVPHCVTPTVPGQVRIISALCFRVEPERSNDE